MKQKIQKMPKKQKKEKIGIIGFGFVGQAIYASTKYKSEVLVYDAYKEIQDNTKLNDLKKECRAIFVCVGTPENKDGSCNTEDIYNVLDNLKNYNGIIIIKSTIPYSKIPKASNICYNPEFLDANTAEKDFRDQTYIVLGGNRDTTEKVQDIYNDFFSLYKVKKFEHCSIKEASDFKYTRNIYGALKVLFWEFIQDTTGNSRKISEMMKNLPVNEMNLVGLDGYRGFGGACFPKDTAAWNSEHNHKLTKFMLDYNKDLQD